MEDPGCGAGGRGGRGGNGGLGLGLGDSAALIANWCIATSTGLLAPLLYGYARVSFKDQEYNGQIDALSHAGCAKILAEKISGARADNRKELAKVLKALAPGDTLIVTRLARLARSTRDLLNTLDAVAKAGAAFKSLAHSSLLESDLKNFRAAISLAKKDLGATPYKGW